MNYNPVKKLEGHELLSSFLRLKTVNGIGSSVSEYEFNHFIKTLLDKLDDDSLSCYLYSMDDINFDILCKKAVEDKNINLWGRELEYKNNELIATYFTKDTLRGNSNDDYSVRNFSLQYIRNLVKDKKYEVSSFNPLDTLESDLKLSKQIAIYITSDLANRYVKDMIEKCLWPKQCSDINEYIYQKNIAPLINLAGSRHNFLQLYIYCLKCIAQMLSNDKNLQISNNKHNCLAYSNFLQLVSPFPFISTYTYNPYEVQNADITIKVNNGLATLSKRACTSFDSLDGDYSTAYSESLLNDDNSLFKGKAKTLN
ncbi:MAG: hypothetical protein WC343_01495 [Bacilli bacterium]